MKDCCVVALLGAYRLFVFLPRYLYGNGGRWKINGGCVRIFSPDLRPVVDVEKRNACFSRGAVMSVKVRGGEN